jgi:transposase-like protein
MKKNVIKIGSRNGRLTVDLDDESQISFDEWLHRKRVRCSELRKNDFIPPELIDLVENGEERTLVRLLLTPAIDDSLPEPVRGWQFDVKVIGTKPNQGVGAGETESADDITAAGALALLLRILLRQLKDAEKEPGAAPVRIGKLLSRSLIGETAHDLLECCQYWNYAPELELVQLIGELLDQHDYKQGAAREFEARQQAIFLLAQMPEIGVRELARQVDVNPTTVLRWKKHSEFKEEVRCKTEWINSLKATGRWDEIAKILEKGRLTKNDSSTLFSILADQRRANKADALAVSYVELVKSSEGR